MTKKKSKGFTLTEIIVVIAIIGILLGIVFVAIGPARKRAKDARIKSDLLQIQNRAENIYLDQGDYYGVCCWHATECPNPDSEISALCDDIEEQSGVFARVWNKANGQYDKFCAWQPLFKEENGSDVYYGVNYEGRVMETTIIDDILWDLCHDIAHLPPFHL